MTANDDTQPGTYRPGARVTTVGELEPLPVGSVVLADAAHQDSSQGAGSYHLAFQRLYDGRWHRGGRSRDTDPDFIVPATVLFRPDAPQPATTDDAIERAGGASCGGSYCTADAQIGPHRHADGVIYRTGAGAEVDRSALREAMLRRWWMDQTGPEADRWETLDADERENVAENSYADTFLAAVLDFLAARGDAATPTEVEWGVRILNRTVQDGFGSRDEAASWALDVEDGTLMQRTVSAWREVS